MSKLAPKQETREPLKRKSTRQFKRFRPVSEKLVAKPSQSEANLTT
jgi:hypothetical protein